MKEKTFKRYLLAAAAMFVAAACGIEGMDEDDGVLSGKKSADNATMIIKASFADSTATRAALIGGDGTDRNNVKFQSSDKLAVFGYDADYENGSELEITKFTISGGPYEDGSADFSGSPAEAESYVALYPYPAGDASLYAYLRKMQGSVTGISFSTSATLSDFNFPTEQSALKGTFDPAAAISAGMVTKQDGSWTVSLNNACALVKFTVGDDKEYAKAVLKSNGGEDISGAMTMSFNPGNGNVSWFGGTEDHVTLKGTILDGYDYYFAVPPTTLDHGFTLELYRSETDTAPYATRSTSKRVEFKRSVILSLGEVNKGNIDLFYGCGSESVPYLINDFADLRKLSNLYADSGSRTKVRGKHFLQTADIDCNGESIILGGPETLSGDVVVEHPFVGTYDGNGKKIHHYKLTRSHVGDLEIGGLFNSTGGTTTIKNLTVLTPLVTDIYVSPSASSNSDNSVKDLETVMGILVGRTAGSDADVPNTRLTLQNCHVKSNASVGMANYVMGGSRKYSTIFGGLIGSAYNTTIENCSNEADFTCSWGLFWESMAGGILGTASGGVVVINKCRNTGKIEGIDGSNGIQVGGIVGQTAENARVEITNCVNTGTISAKCGPRGNGINDKYNDAWAGGIIGHIEYNGSGRCIIYNCLNKGDISANSTDYGQFIYAGGIAGNGGDEDDMNFALCINTGNIAVYGSSSNMHADPIFYYDDPCVGCYWLAEQSCSESGAKSYGRSKNDEKALYFYRKINADDTPNNRFQWLGNTSSTGNTEWTNAQWQSRTVRWKGEATWGGENDLDLDF